MANYKHIYKIHEGFKSLTIRQALERGAMRFVAHMPRRKQRLVLRLGDWPGLGYTVDQLATMTGYKPATVRRYLIDIELQTGFEIRRDYSERGATRYWLER